MISGTSWKVVARCDDVASESSTAPTMVVQGVGQASMQAAPGRAPKDDDSTPKSNGSVGSNEPFSVSMPVTPCLKQT